jgi:hypothetical protein
MTQLLESAFKKISSLPEIEQNIYAKFIIDEMESELSWGSTFSESEDLLEEMANEALKDFDNKGTEKLDIDKL